MEAGSYATASTAQIAVVVTYIRTSFGNAYPAPVTEAEVRRIASVTPHP